MAKFAKAERTTTTTVALGLFLMFSSSLISQGTALKCHECLWLSDLIIPKGVPFVNCSSPAPNDELVECEGENIKNFYPSLTVKTDPPVCIKAKYVAENGAAAIERYCGYPLANATTAGCIDSLEASSKPDPASGQSFDPKHPVTFFYCKDKDGCNSGPLDDKCTRSAGLVQRCSAILVLMLSALSLAKIFP